MRIYSAAFILGMIASGWTFAGILGVSGNVATASAPADIRTGAWESDTIRIFPEQQNLILTSGIFVNLSAPGAAPSGGTANSTPLTIPVGTSINSYYAHFDAVGERTNANPALGQGSVTFDSDVLGLIIYFVALGNTDAYPGLSGTLYPTEGGRDLEIDPAAVGQFTNDEITLSVDRRTVNFNFRDGATPDDVRIITSVPEPSVAGSVTGLLALIGCKRSGRYSGRRRHPEVA